jgi:predicted nucleic acid-binding protein
MIFVDSNVPMYLVGADHPHKRRIIELVPQLLGAHEALVTSAETFQEVIHRYVAIGDHAHLAAAYAGLEALVSSVADVTKADVDRARAMAGEHRGLSSRDCLHVAVMERLGCSRIWSYDAGFDAMPSILRIL